MSKLMYFLFVRVVMKLVLGGEKVSVSENSIKLVTKKEFKEIYFNNLHYLMYSMRG